MSQVYSLVERIIIIALISAGSIIIPFVFLCRHVDIKKTSKIIFLICLIYSSFFVFLNVIAVFDLVFVSQKGFEKLFKFITTFYYVFNIVDKALGFFLFNVLIYYLESGYYSKIKKVFDIFIRKYYSIRKMTACEIIVKLSINLTLIVGLLIILIIYRNHFGIESPLDYLNILLDCYSIYEIYICVGFFIVQLIKDCKRNKKCESIEKYNRYSIRKIIEKTKKYLDAIKKTYEKLNKEIKTYENEKTYYN